MGLNKDIYIVECENYYKIGTSGDIERRLRQYQANNPFPVKLIKMYYDIYNPVQIEKWIHLELKEYKHCGEWFKTDLNTILDVTDKIIEQYKENLKNKIYTSPRYDNYSNKKSNYDPLKFKKTGERRKPKTGEWYLLSERKGIVVQAKSNISNIYDIVKKIS